MEISLIVLCVIFSGCYVRSEVIIYPIPFGIKASDQFLVKIKQGSGPLLNSFVYISRSNNRIGQASSVKPNRTLSWTSFGFIGEPVTVTVELPYDFNTCIVRPKRYAISICQRAKQNTAVFLMRSNYQKVSVEFDHDQGSIKSDIVNKLLIFANPPETHVPNPNDPGVLYFDRGIYNLFGQLHLNSDIHTVYLAPGSFVKGGFRTTGPNPVTIIGRGILSGDEYPFHDSRFLWGIINMDIGSNHTVEGITMVDSPQFFYRGQSNHNILRNVKTLGAWTFNSDGVGIGAYGLVEDSFFHTNDDTFKVYNDGLVVRRCVVWQAQNGAVFQFGWWNDRKAKNISISDIDVIHTDWCTFKNEPCSLSANDAILDLGGATTAFNMTNVTISNVYIEGQCPRIFYFVMNPMAKGTVTKMYLDNWTVEMITPDTKLDNELSGAYLGGKLKSWYIKNLTLSDQCISDPSNANIKIDPKTTMNIQFQCP